MLLDIIRSTSPLPYREAHERQKRMHARRVAGDIGDTLWLLEHLPVITTGIRRNQNANFRRNPVNLNIEVINTERGGQVTYHGPGQLVGYLFVSMHNHGFQVKRFVRQVEEAFIRYLDTAHGIRARHDEEHTGVWVGKEKITAIGLALRERVTLHGFAFNVNTDLRPYDWIVPCGIADRDVTSLKKLTGKTENMNETATVVGEILRTTLGYSGGDYNIES